MRRSHHTPRTTPGSVAGWLALTVTAALVAGCTTTPDPTHTISSGPTPPTSTTSAFTSSATLIPTTSKSTPTVAVPAKAQENTPDGASEFVNFLVSEVNRAFETPRSAILDTYLDSTCLGCQGLRKDVAGVESQSHRAIADVWSTDFAIAETWESKKATVRLRIEQHRVDFVDSSGRIVNYMKPGSHDYLLTLTHRGTWHVTRWQKIEL